MSDSIIKVEGVGKSYLIGHQREQGYTALRDVVMQKAKGFARGVKNTLQGNQIISGNEIEEFWALKDLNFEIKKGEAVGIIGRNGAGKSTLLKVLSRITEPTTGKITLNGRVASLLEVGTGFHPELSGRENIFLNGAILGMTRSEIKSKFDEIVDFSGVEKFLDTPVKRYSSGMYVRLAFAVAAHLEPEILVVDEVLAVGDAEFQKKCLGKMEDVSQKEGRTVLFVSHNMTAVRTLCRKGILLDKGKILFQGDINKALNLYQKSDANVNEHWIGEDGEAGVKIKETKVFTTDSRQEFINSATVNISLKIELLEDFNELMIGFTLKSIHGNPVASTVYNDHNDHAFLAKGEYEIMFSIPAFTLATGEYEVFFNISIPFVKVISSEKINLFFKVVAEDSLGNRFFMENNKFFNSIIRPNWFNNIKKIE